MTGQAVAALRARERIAAGGGVKRDALFAGVPFRVNVAESADGPDALRRLRLVVDRQHAAV